MRVVSLVPSATETLMAWGITPVAVTRFCEQPQLAHVGGTKDPDVDAIAALRPDVVVMCTQENRLVDAEALRASGINVHAIDITRLAHVGPQMEALAHAVQAAAPTGPWPLGDDVAPPRLRAFVPIWKRPWMTISGDTYGSSLLRALGVENVYDDHSDRYPTVEIGDVIVRKPDVVLATSEPYPFAERHRVQLEEIAPVIFINGQDLFWWGARTPAALQRLQAVLESV